MKNPDTKPIAYRNGNSGSVFHPECWFKFANEYFIAVGARSTIGTIYYPGAERETLAGVKCHYCGLGFQIKGNQ